MKFFDLMKAGLERRGVRQLRRDSSPEDTKAGHGGPGRHTRPKSLKVIQRGLDHGAADLPSLLVEMARVEAGT